MWSRAPTLMPGPVSSNSTSIPPGPAWSLPSVSPPLNAWLGGVQNQVREYLLELSLATRDQGKAVSEVFLYRYVHQAPSGVLSSVEYSSARVDVHIGEFGSELAFEKLRRLEHESPLSCSCAP